MVKIQVLGQPGILSQKGIVNPLVFSTIVLTFNCMQNMDNKTPSSSLSLGKRIKEIRKSKGLTQEELAIKAGVAYTTLTKVENEAIKNPSFETVVAIAKGLEVDFDELIK